MDSTTTTTKISILGTEGTGKTVFLAALTHALASATTLPRITAKNTTTLRYTAGIYDQLELGSWPKSTDVGIRQNLRWLWHASDRSQHELQTFDCAGQDFRAIFESEFDAELNPTQLALKKEFYDSDLILLLLNFHEALKIYNVPGKNITRLELSYAPAAAIEKLRAAGVATYAVFAQADLYRERVQNDWGGDFSRALEDVLPDLHFALSQTGSPYEYIAAVETELRGGKILPKEGCKPGNLGVLIKSVDEFLVKNKDVIAQRAERRAKEEKISTGKTVVIESTPEKLVADKPVSATDGERRNTAFRIPGLDIDLQPIPAGSFTMGSPENEDGSDDETLHHVTISKPYWLGKYPVTQRQWEALMGKNPSYFKGVGKDAPVEKVSWNDAKTFCDKLTEIEHAAGRLPEGYVYTLPTEAEWEYACRARSTRRFGGSGSLEDMGWYRDNSRDTTHPVGQKQANAWGLYDMHGNVSEWCGDWYTSYPYGSASDPVGAASGTFRVHRGGDWNRDAQHCRSAFRFGSKPDFRANRLGFRLALSSIQN